MAMDADSEPPQARLRQCWDVYCWLVTVNSCGRVRSLHRPIVQNFGGDAMQDIAVGKSLQPVEAPCQLSALTLLGSCITSIGLHITSHTSSYAVLGGLRSDSALAACCHFPAPLQSSRPSIVDITVHIIIALFGRPCAAGIDRAGQRLHRFRGTAKLALHLVVSSQLPRLPGSLFARFNWHQGLISACTHAQSSMACVTRVSENAQMLLASLGTR
jgi:hypothetical protein